MDATFGRSGSTTIPFTGSTWRIPAFGAVQSDGKILNVGSVRNGNFVFTLARLNTNGTLDTTFNSTGKVTKALGTSSAIPTGIAIQSDGKIIAIGRAIETTYQVFYLVRYNSDGSLDSTFGTGGVVSTAFGTVDDTPSAIVIQPSDGKILVAGQTSNGTRTSIALARYNTNGSLDTSFDSSGNW